MITPAGNFQTPYTVQASSELSEDYFLTSDYRIGTGDEVIPFVNPYTKLVEAIVFTQASGSVLHLQRDPSARSGWLAVTIDLSENLLAATGVAVAGNGSAVYMVAYGQPADQMGAGPAWFTQLDSATSWDAGYSASYDDLGFTDLNIDPSTVGGLKGGIDPHGDCYFYVSAVAGGSTGLLGWLPGSDVGAGQVGYQLLQTLDSSSSDLAVTDYIVLYDYHDAAKPVGYSLVLTANQLLSVYKQSPQTDTTVPVFADAPIPDLGGGGVTALLWAWTTDPGSGGPGYAFQTANETWFVVGDGSDKQSVFDQPAAAVNSVAVWTGDLDVVNLLDTNSALNSILQQPDGSWRAIPITPGKPSSQSPASPVSGLASIFGVPTDPTQSTLFAVGLDETLSVLTLDEAGWTQTLIRQDGTSQLQLGSYRVQISLQDANGIPVAGGEAKISTDRPVGFWQSAGSSYVTPAAPVTLTADDAGQITFSVPAEELDCAVLTVQALDLNGAPADGPFTVTTDYDVRGFLQGTGTLTDLGQLSGNALLQARNSGGTDLFPGLTGLSGDDQAAALKGTLTALNQFVVAGENTQTEPGPSDISKVVVAMSGQVPSVETTTGTSGYATGDLELTLSVGRLFDTIGHALRHGAARLASITVQWSDAVKGWAVTLGAEIAGVVQQFTNLVISDIRDAFHAIGGFFQALGADIVDAVNWLKHNVTELLQAAWANGKVIAGFIGSAPAGLAHQVQQLDFSVEHFFSNLENEATTLISELAGAVTGKTLGNAPQPTAPAGPDTGSSSAQSGLAKDFGLFTRVINDTPGMWLWHKFQQDVPALPALVSAGMPQLPQGSYTSLVNDQLAQDWADGIGLVNDLQKFMQDEFQSAFGRTRSSAQQTSLPGLYGSFADYKFADLDTVVVKFLQFCDDIAETVLKIVIQALDDLTATLTSSFPLVSPTSLLGILLDDILHVDPQLTIAEIVGVILAFPATLVAKVTGHGDAMPASLPAFPAASDGLAPAGVADLDPEVKLWLGILGGTTQAIWGFADIIGDLQTLKGEDGKRGTQSGVIDIFDAFCPVVESALLFPFPPYSDEEKPYVWMIPAIVLTAVLPSAMILLGQWDWPELTGALKGAGIDDSIVNAMSDYVSPFVQAFSGAANTAFGIGYQVKTGDTYWVDLAGTALGNLSFLLAVFGTYWLNSSTEDVPVIIKMVVDAIGNLGAAICVYESSSLPPK